MKTKLLKRIGSAALAMAMVLTSFTWTKPEEVKADNSYIGHFNITGGDSWSSDVYVSDFQVWEEYGNIQMSFTGSAAGFKVLLDDEIVTNYELTCDCYPGYTWVGSELVYFESQITGSLGSYVAPGSHTMKVIPYRLIPGENENTYQEESECCASTTFEVLPGEISELEVEIGFDHGKSGGLYYAYLSWFVSKYVTYPFDVYRSEDGGKNYKKIGTVNNEDVNNTYFHYRDDNVDPTKRYAYYLKYTVGTVEYQSETVWKDNDSFSLNSYITMTDSGKPLLSSYGYANRGAYTGYTIYRSTKEKSEYKKIADSYKSYFVDETAKAGTTYYYKVSMFYYNYVTGKTYIVSKNDTPLKFVPKIRAEYFNVKIKTTSATSFHIEWDKQNAATYKVYVKLKNGYEPAQLVATTNKTSCDVKGLKAGKDYTIRIRAFDKSGKKFTDSYAYSASLGFGYPDAEIKKKTYSYSNGTFTETFEIGWDKIYGADGYKIMKYDDEKGEYVEIKKLSVNTTSYKYVAKYKENKSVQLRIVAYKGKKEKSDYLHLQLQMESPSLKLTKKNDSTVTLSWNKVAGATEYEILQYDAKGLNGYYVYSGNKNTCEANNLQPGVEYVFVVRARGGSCYSGYWWDWSSYYWDHPTLYANSNAEKNSVVKYTIPLTATSITKVENAKAGSATVTWKKVSSATGYTVYRSTSEKGTYTKVGTTTAKTLSFEDTKLSKGKTYYYYVVANIKTNLGYTASSKASAKVSVKIAK